jgi:ubiquinone/menaquinone biosynthesis C-methylase UbiE
MIEFDQTYLLQLEAQRQSPNARAKLERYADMLSPSPGDCVLDLGCGGGAFSRLLVEEVGSGGQVVGVDVSENAIALAQTLSTALTPELLTYRVADGHSLPFEDEAFDSVACISVLEFCEDPALVLYEAYRVLRPGGRLLVVNSDEDTRAYNGHDVELGRKVMRAIADRGGDPWLARRLAHLLEATGFRIREEVVLAIPEREYKPESSGYIHARSWRDHLLAAGHVSTEEYDRWLADLQQCAQEGSYFYSVTTYAYLAERSLDDQQG